MPTLNVGRSAIVAVSDGHVCVNRRFALLRLQSLDVLTFLPMPNVRCWLFDALPQSSAANLAIASRLRLPPAA